MRNDNTWMSVTVLEADQNASGAGEKAAAARTAGDAVGDAACNKTRRPVESRIAGDEAELLARTAEEWDLIRDLPGERFLIRRKIPRP